MSTSAEELISLSAAEFLSASPLLTKVIFYKQVRVDGKWRVGFGRNQQPLATQLFAGAAAPSDPTLRWCLDIRFAALAIPAGLAAVRAYLLRQDGIIRQLLPRVRQELLCGPGGTGPQSVAFRVGITSTRIQFITNVLRADGREELLRELLVLPDFWSTTIRELAADA